MLKSMTGYGAGKCESEELGSLQIDLRSVNSRYLEIYLRLPNELSTFDPIIRSYIQGQLHRGKVTVEVKFHAIPGSVEEYRVNEALLQALEEFTSRKGQEPSLDQLLQVSGVITVAPDDSKKELLESTFMKALEESMKGLIQEREREGQSLRSAMLEIAHEMLENLEKVDAARGAVTQKYQQKLLERLEELLGPKASSLDPGRLEQEVAFFADKADITEEVIRLRTHLQHLDKILSDTDKPVRGKKIEFLNQEIMREINTIGSKARDLEITGYVLQLKNLNESLREQTANIE